MSCGAARGGAPVGVIDELGPIETGAVLTFRAWSDGAAEQSVILEQFVLALGQDHGRAAVEAFANLTELCARHGRRPLMRHHLTCRCLGADECCFANLIVQAAEGDPEDAMLIATLLVRADMAPCAAALARDVGLALKRLSLRFEHSGGLPESAARMH